MSNSNTKKLFPNPFYVLLLLASTLFVITTLAYLIEPSIRQKAVANGNLKAGPGPFGVGEWLDRQGPLVLGIEFVVMLVSGFLAMATDRYFPERLEQKAVPSDRI